MQERTRVFVIGDHIGEARRIGDLFDRSAGFTLIGLGTISAVPEFDPGRADVVVVKTGRSRSTRTSPPDLPLGTSLRPFEVPVLWLGSVPHNQELKSEDAVLPPDSTPAQIRAAVGALAAGLLVGRFSNGKQQLQSHEEFEFAALDPLTEREIEVLNLVAEGFSNPEIAKLLRVSRNTIKFHVSSIIGKLGTSSRTEAVTLGLKRGLIVV